MDLTLAKATDKDVETIRILLKENDLPNQDINTGRMDLYLANNDSDLIGIIGLECFNKTALLRSMVIKEQYRNKGYGKELCKNILEISKERKIKEVFILTCSAKDFFIRLGFAEINRNNAPNSIKKSTQFSSLCPQSAICLKVIVQ